MPGAFSSSLASLASLRAAAAACLWASAAACSTGDAALPGADGERAPPEATPTSPTWFRDVEPIVQVECAGCHTTNGTGGFALDQRVTTSLASLIAERVSERRMPPWPPGPEGAAIVGARALDPRLISTLVAWDAAGAPQGDPRDHVTREPRAGALPARPPDLHLELSAAEAYREPVSPFVTDEIRCFVLDVPAGANGAWVVAARWRAGVPAGIHALGGVAVDATTAATARARSGRDGRSGFECGGGLGDLPRGPAIGASGSGGEHEGATVLPGSAAVRVPVGGAIVMRVHYAVKHLARGADRSGVDLWLADDVARRAARPLLLASLSAPVEVPCPTGPSVDPSQPCSRENAFARLAGADAAGARARADALLTACGTSLGAAATGARVDGNDEHFVVASSCTSTVPFDGTIRVVEARQQTHGASIRVEAERGDGTWATALDIPRWRWAWEGSYVLSDGVPVTAGRRLRVSCTFDNGTANQWSALTGEAGHDAVALPPLLPPAYLVAAPHRAADACSAHLGIERAPHRAAAWLTPCHEAEAVVDDACGPGSIDLTSRGCSGIDEDRSVAVLGASLADVRATHCPGAKR